MLSYDDYTHTSRCSPYLKPVFFVSVAVSFCVYARMRLAKMRGVAVHHSHRVVAFIFLQTSFNNERQTKRRKYGRSWTS